MDKQSIPMKMPIKYLAPLLPLCKNLIIVWKTPEK